MPDVTPKVKCACYRRGLRDQVKAICGDVFDYDGFRRLEDIGVTDIMVCPWYFYPGDTSALDH